MSQAESAESEPHSAEPPGLPPVEPPSAGFIVQLFIVPAIIMIVIVMVWLAFNWLAHLGEDPQTYIRQLKNRDWHAAYNLAQSLHDGQHNQQLVENEKFAQEVSDILRAELAEGSFEPEAVLFRRYLCRSLGFFHVDTGLPALMEAARTDRDEREIPVRCEAIESIVQLTSNLQKSKPPKTLDQPELLAVLSDAAQDDARYTEPADDKNKLPERVWSVRERAVFALGILGTPEAAAKLGLYLDSSEPNVRYNAAVGLARHGKATDRSVEVFAEMLDPTAGLAAESTDTGKTLKRQIMLSAAIPAIGQLVESKTTTSLAPLQAPLEQLAKQSDDPEAQLKAKALLIAIENSK